MKKSIKLKNIKENELENFCKTKDKQLKRKVKHCVKCPFLIGDDNYCVARIILFHRDDKVEIEVEK